MREVIPFPDRFALQEAIDNGGRFYNLFSSAGDALVTRGELAKAAGTISGGMKAILFLELAKWNLDENVQDGILDLLEPKLRDRYEADKPTHWKASEIESRGIVGSSVIVTGYPDFLEDRSEFNGCVMIPIQVGTVTSFIPVPLYDQFHVYKVYDDEATLSAPCIIATDRQDRWTDSGPVRVAGILRELKCDDQIPASHPCFLETHFYTKLEHTGI